MSKLINSTNESFETDVLQSNLPVLVDFWAAWCAPCKAISPILDDLSGDYEGKMAVVKVDVEEADEVALKYGIRSIPALFIFKDGEVVDKVIGQQPRAKIAELMEKHI